ECRGRIVYKEIRIPRITEESLSVDRLDVRSRGNIKAKRVVFRGQCLVKIAKRYFLVSPKESDNLSLVLRRIDSRNRKIAVIESRYAHPRAQPYAVHDHRIL